MIAALHRALEERDAYSGAHSLRVTGLAEILARRLGWDERRLAALRLGGLLHDVGKLTLPQSLLRKPGPLDARELALVRMHPIEGARLVVPIFRAGSVALACVLYHHERWDGCGYPIGRSGAGIPVEARVLSVADAFDAMTSSRPYRAALTPDAALAEVERCAGSQFDPDVALTFAQAWEAGEVVPAHEPAA
jgi:HD-GYP domain-containing protein (c-di-GMP phosphodiesterase class II)